MAMSADPVGSGSSAHRHGAQSVPPPLFPGMPPEQTIDLCLRGSTHMAGKGSEGGLRAMPLNLLPGSAFPDSRTREASRTQLEMALLANISRLTSRDTMISQILLGSECISAGGCLAKRTEGGCRANQS